MNILSINYLKIINIHTVKKLHSLKRFLVKLLTQSSNGTFC